MEGTLGKDETGKGGEKELGKDETGEGGEEVLGKCTLETEDESALKLAGRKVDRRGKREARKSSACRRK